MRRGEEVPHPRDVGGFERHTKVWRRVVLAGRVSTCIVYIIFYLVHRLLIACMFVHARTHVHTHTHTHAHARTHTHTHTHTHRV